MFIRWSARGGAATVGSWVTMVDDILVWLPSIGVYTRRARAATASSGLVAGRWMDDFTSLSPSRSAARAIERSPDHCSCAA
jgi:hypothetical protein